MDFLKFLAEAAAAALAARLASDLYDELTSSSDRQ